MESVKKGYVNGYNIDISLVVIWSLFLHKYSKIHIKPSQLKCNKC